MFRKVTLLTRCLFLAICLLTAFSLWGQKRDLPQRTTGIPPVAIRQSLAERCKERGLKADCPEELQQDADQPGYERGVLIVRLKPPANKSFFANLVQSRGDRALAQLPSSLRALASKYRVTSIAPLFNPAMVSPERIAQIKKQFPQRTLRARHTAQVPRLDNIFKLTLDRQVDLDKAAKEMSRDPNVIFAEPNRIVRVAYVPNDQYYNSNDLWGLFKVQAGSAWNTATGQGVVVAVIDTGVDLGHPDLNANIWSNPGETMNSMDDDFNGLVDDVQGWDFAYGDNSPSDIFGHGTHVAGTIAALGNNQYGVVGLAFQSKIMPLKGLGDNGGGLTTNLANAIQYAIDRGADVINNSWGGPDSALTRTMVDAAHSMGVVVVSAGGNNNTEACNFCPANAETGLTVSAFKANDTRSSFSNFGVKIDVGAPGGQGGSPATLTPGTDILSTVPATSTLASGGYPTLTGGDGKKYMPLAGTSMASPHVAALAALLIQVHPVWTNEEIRQAIRQTADNVSTPGFDTDSGYGRINAGTAMTLGGTTTALPTALLQEPRNCAFIVNSVPITGLAQTAGGPGSYVVDVGAGDMPSSFGPIGSGSTPLNGTLAMFNPLNFQDGRQTIRVTTTDQSTSKTSEDRNVINVDNVLISAPANNELMTGTSYNVLGKTAGNLGFTNYKLEWAPGCNATTGFQTITTSTTQVNAIGPLGNWNLASLPDGQATLRLSASFSGNGGFVAQDQKCVIVDKLVAPGWPVAINHVPSFKSPKIADLDGDGTNEIVLGASVFQANGSVRAGWNNFPGLGRTNPAVLNVDNAPDLEVIAAVFDEYYAPSNPSSSPNGGAPVIYAYKPNKSVLWSLPLQNPHTNMTNYNYGVPSSLSAADVDGDGQPEIVFTMLFNYFNTTPVYETWVYVLDASTGAVQTSFPVAGISQNSVALADVDGNGTTELIIESWLNNSYDGRISVVTHSGTALTGWPVQIPAAADTQGFGNIDPVLADVDGDGHPEILVGKHLLNYDGTTKSGWPFAALARSTGVMAPFPDGDCPMEVRTGGGNSVVFWAGEHTGQIPFTKNNTFENLLVLMGGENGSKGNPVIADIDGDQQIEVVATSELGSTVPNKPMPLYGSDALSPLEPASFPRFVQSPNPAGYSDPIRSTPAIGDVDNDGNVDMLVAAGGQLYLWNLSKPFSPSLSYWPMFQHDLRNTGLTSSSNWEPDLYMQDTPADSGVEPDTVSSLLYISSDVWIRNSNDTVVGSTNPGPATQAYFANEHQHENPLYVNPTTESHAYVKVRNRGCKSSTGTEKLRVYWADASTGLPWPGMSVWNELDCVAGSGVGPCSLPVIAPGEDYVAELPWVPPDPVATGTDHYCLIARIETVPTGSFGMTYAEGPLLWQNVANNNNIVWKNVTVVTGSGKGKVTVRNPLNRDVPVTLQFAVPPAESRDHLLLYADIFVDIGPDLMNKWRRGGQRPQGFTVVDAKTIKITDPGKVVLGGMLFRAGEKRTIEVRMQLKPQIQTALGQWNNPLFGSNRQFNWDIIQTAQLTPKAKPTLIGGERYVLKSPPAQSPECKCADATLVGDTVGTRFNQGPGPINKVVGNPIEIPGAGPVLGGAGPSPRWNIDYGTNTIRIDFLQQPATYGKGSYFTFSSLDPQLRGCPPAFVSGMTVTTNKPSTQFNVVGAATFGPHTVKIQIAPDSKNLDWQPGEFILVKLKFACESATPKPRDDGMIRRNHSVSRRDTDSARAKRVEDSDRQVVSKPADSRERTTPRKKQGYLRRGPAKLAVRPRRTNPFERSNN